MKWFYALKLFDEKLENIAKLNFYFIITNLFGIMYTSLHHFKKTFCLYFYCYIRLPVTRWVKLSLNFDSESRDYM